MYGKFVREEQVKCRTFTLNAWSLAGLTLPNILRSFQHPKAQHQPTLSQQCWVMLRQHVAFVCMGLNICFSSFDDVISSHVFVLKIFFFSGWETQLLWQTICKNEWGARNPSHKFSTRPLSYVWCSAIKIYKNNYPRSFTRDPRPATRDPRPATRDPRPATCAD